MKENLFVKPIVRPHTPKYSIQDLKQIKKIDKQRNSLEEEERREYKNHQSSLEKSMKKQKKPNKLDSTQISQALSMNSSLKLTDIKNIIINHSSPRHIK